VLADLTNHCILGQPPPYVAHLLLLAAPTTMACAVRNGSSILLAFIFRNRTQRALPLLRLLITMLLLLLLCVLCACVCVYVRVPVPVNMSVPRCVSKCVCILCGYFFVGISLWL